MSLTPPSVAPFTSALAPQAPQATGIEDVADDARHALAPQVVTPPPVRPRYQTSPGAVRDIARRLFAHFDPATPSAWRGLVRRDVPHVYAPEVVGDIDWQLADVAVNGGRLYLQGAALGVGVSTLVADYARAFNDRAARAGALARMVYVHLEPGTNTVPKFYDTLALALRAPLSTAELRFHGSTWLALRALGGAAQQHVTTIILDNVHVTPPKVRDAVGTLMRVTDPNYFVGTDPGPQDETARRVGVVLVDQLAPEALFRDSLDVLLHLECRVRTLLPYRTDGAVAEALRQAGIGLDDIDLEDPEDRAVVRAVRQATHGLVALMRPLFELIDIIARSTDGSPRPDPVIVAAALPFHRRMVRLFSAASATAPGGRLYAVRAASAPRPLGADATGGAAEATATVASTGGHGPAKALGARKGAKAAAAKEARATTRKGHANPWSADS